jgi:hypothetical protein
MPPKRPTAKPRKSAKVAAPSRKKAAAPSHKTAAVPVRAAKADPAKAFCKAVEDALSAGDASAISDEALQRAFIAVVKLYAVKAEASGESFLPFGMHDVTATEAAVTSCGIMRAADLNLFDMAMWFRRPLPES